MKKMNLLERESGREKHAREARGARGRGKVFPFVKLLYRLDLLLFQLEFWAFTLQLQQRFVQRKLKIFSLIIGHVVGLYRLC